MKAVFSFLGKTRRWAQKRPNVGSRSLSSLMICAAISFHGCWWQSEELWIVKSSKIYWTKFKKALRIYILRIQFSTESCYFPHFCFHKEVIWREKNWKISPYLANFHDLNPLKNVWGLMKNHLVKRIYEITYFKSLTQSITQGI